MAPLRRKLFFLAAAAIAPLATIAGIGLVVLIHQQREEAARAGIELTRALATAVGAELGRSVSVLEAVVTSPTLDAEDLAGFHRRAVRVVASQPNWRAIVLLDPSGAALVHSGHPVGAAPPPLADRESFERVRRLRSPVIGSLTEDGSVAGPPRLDFSVQVPVVRDGALRYVATALVAPDAIFAILQRQRVPADWVISIFDASGRRVARSRLHAESIGKPGAPSVVELMAQPADEGWGRTIAVEGDPIYTAYSRVKGAGWTVATGIPIATVDGAMWRSALILGGGMLLSIVIGAVAALVIARGITAPIAALRRAAEALGRREPLAPPVTDIQEIRRVGEALAGAAEERAGGERERDQLLEREQRARAAAEAANRAKDEFLAMLGHELRNPLGAVTNAVGLLDYPGLSPEAATRAREIIRRQTAHLARLTDDLLDAGRVITGKIVLNRQPVDLAETVTRALATLAASIETGRHHIVREMRPVWVDADPTRIEQIAANLVGNAVKYTGAGGTITVTVGEEGSSAVLRVRDDGIGMSPELAARVFELFVQGERTLDRTPGGLGIGLTVVRRLAELHGGSATAYSAGPGEGCEVTVRLPSVPRPAAARPALRKSAPAKGAARHVLVVEDNDDARLGLCELLELGGHQVRAERDGLAGLATALDLRPEIVLIDVGLPGIDGYEVARRIRAAETPGRRMTLVALTGYGLPDDRRRALEAGFDVHLVKPVTLDALTEVLAGGDAPQRTSA